MYSIHAAGGIRGIVAPLKPVSCLIDCLCHILAILLHIPCCDNEVRNRCNESTRDTFITNSFNVTVFRDSLKASELICQKIATCLSLFSGIEITIDGRTRGASQNTV
jgi:hypothetical protein